MQELIKKMIIKAMAAHHADVDPVKKPGQKFVINDTNACVDAIKAMKPIGGDQSNAVFALHKDIPARIGRDCASAARMDFRHCS
jgi:hypothetical protein